MGHVQEKKLTPAGGTNMLLFGMIAVGVATFFGGLAVNAQRTWFSFLLNHAMFLGLAVGAVFFMVMHYLASSGWIVAVRRVPEAMASWIFVAFVMNVVLLFGLSKIYPWMDHELMHNDHMLHHKAGFFSTGFYTFRILAFYAVACFFTWKLLRLSTSQDELGGVENTQKTKPVSALFLVFFCPLFTVFATDLIKSLDPKWFSTIFGVYVFIGFLQAGVAATVVITRMLQKHGYRQEVTADHFHDLGKYLKGFSVFWAYIAVSQYLLIWYANLPEETTYYMARQVPGWMGWSLLVPVLRFFLPFVFLLPRMAKRTGGYLEKVCWVVLVGAWVDLYWLIMPHLLPNGVSIGWQDLGLLVGFLGAFAFVVRRFLSRNNVVPVKDPYLHETLHHHVM
ncbi:MAG: molybdopterin oxidoreductase [Bdellovibrionales bacterium]|nr:molybdopterin oxidoreductase [Bdellovibrionales bacterium]